MSRNRSWCFTLNNYSNEEYNNIINIDCKYLIVGKEVGESGTPHLQGYIEFENARTLNGVKKLISNRSHLEIRRGTPLQASDYCKKENDFHERGVISAQGSRIDLDELKDRILHGENYDDIIVENFQTWAKYKNGFDKIADIAALKKKRNGQMTEGIWIYGPTGSGKSHDAYEMAGDDVYNWVDDKGWWDGYCGQHTVVINDFRGAIEYAKLLQIIDKWEYAVNRRGKAPMPFTSKRVIITSSLSPEQVYCNLHQRDRIAQLMRRLRVIEKNGTEVHQGNTDLVVVSENDSIEFSIA